MNNFHIFGLQAGLTFVSFFLLTKYYIWPKLKTLPSEQALKALVATNIFRHLGLVFLVTPQIVAASVSKSWTMQVAIGDMAAVILAMVAFVGLATKAKWARNATWIFNIVGIADLLLVYTSGIMKQAWDFDIGSAWYIATYIAPVFIIIHILIFKLLLKSNSKPL